MAVKEWIIDDEQSQGVGAISFVSEPAMESDFVTLSKEYKVELQATDDAKRLITGVVMIPNKSIPRSDGNEYFFSKDTIQKTMEIFFKNGNQGNTTLEHEIALNKNYVVESWIVVDENKDKTASLGIKAPVGSWVVTQKVEDEKTYNLAKEGVIKGFSLEGIFKTKTVQLNKNEMDKKGVLDVLMGYFKDKDAEEKLATMLSKETVDKDYISKVELEANYTLKTEINDEALVALTAEKETVDADKIALEKEVADLKVELAKKPDEAHVVVTTDAPIVKEPKDFADKMTQFMSTLKQ